MKIVKRFVGWLNRPAFKSEVSNFELLAFIVFATLLTSLLDHLWPVG